MHNQNGQIGQINQIAQNDQTDKKAIMVQRSGWHKVQNEKKANMAEKARTPSWPNLPEWPNRPNGPEWQKRQHCSVSPKKQKWPE